MRPYTLIKLKVLEYAFMLTMASNFRQLILKFMRPLELDEACAVVIEEAKTIFKAVQGTIYLANSKGILESVFTTETLAETPALAKNHPIAKAWLADSVTVLKNHQVTTQSEVIVIIPLTSLPQPLGVVVLKVVDTTEEVLTKMQFFGLLAALTLKNTLLQAEARSSLEAQNIFISMASHELKTPLTTISAYSQLLQKKITDGKEIKADWLSVLNLATIRMTRMINELLQVNKIKSGKMPYTFDICNVATVAEQAVSDFKTLYPNNIILFTNGLESEKAGDVTADFDKLVVAVSHLLSSAVRFSGTDKPLEISVYTLKSKVCIQITDQGMGIEKRHLPHLFQEFYKTGERANDGLGLGLYISKRIIEAHRGQIKVESKIGEGTSFFILIPVAK